jgi:hypothetical protein
VKEAPNSKSHPEFMVVDESFHPVTRALGLNNNQALRDVGALHQHLASTSTMEA